MLRIALLMQLLTAVAAQGYISTHGCSTLCLMQYSSDEYKAGERSPCGCGFVARTTRDQLQEMDLPTLRSKLADVKSDLAELDSETKETEAHNKKVAADREGMVAKLEKKLEDVKADIA